MRFKSINLEKAHVINTFTLSFSKGRRLKNCLLMCMIRSVRVTIKGFPKKKVKEFVSKNGMKFGVSNHSIVIHKARNDVFGELLLDSNFLIYECLIRVIYIHLPQTK